MRRTSDRRRGHVTRTFMHLPEKSKPASPDKRKNDPDLTPCPRCGKHVKVKPDGSYSIHKMPISGVPCTPDDPREWVLLGECHACGMRIPLQWRRLAGRLTSSLVLPASHNCEAGPFDYTLIEEAV